MADDAQQADAPVVTSPRRILRYLREIHRGNLDLTVTPESSESGRKYSTRILKIDQDSDLIVLHQLLPADWRRFFNARTPVEVSCKLANGTIRFSAMISPLDDGENLSYSVLSLPERVKRHQLRSFFRVSLLKYEGRLFLHREEGPALEAGVKDLSLGGLLCHVRCAAGDLATSETPERCRLDIPGLLTLEFSATLRHLAPLEAGITQAGLKFHDLTPDQLKEIRRAISKVERDNIRKDLA